MANLITEKQKKIIRTDYYVRLFSLSLFFISLLGTFLLAYVIPYYLSVKDKDLQVADQFKSVINAENKENSGESTTRVVNKTLDEMKVVTLYNQAGQFPSIYFNKVIENKNSNIKLTKLSFGVSNKDQVSLLVDGISKNREGLVTFIDDLKSKAGFSTVASPISDFAKDSNISFTLNIKLTI